ncbi:hypothetical protein OG984_05785 [Nocardioides sp. NBC_00368]|uniref:hypothetical protein n=1 Tax=Nocardioides sp. NBC_00368 TaxID=2976000 RepID=UPI002E246FEF
MTRTPGSSKPPGLEPPIIVPRPEARHCWRHLSPSPGSEGDPVFLLAWAHSPADQFGKYVWWAQIVRMTTPTDWSTEWVSADQLSTERYAPGEPMSGRRPSSNGNRSALPGVS